MLVAWPAVDYEEGPLLTRRGRFSLACSGRHLPARWCLISSFLRFSGLSSFSSSCPQPVHASSVPFHPHITRRARPGRDNPHKPEAGAVNSLPRGGTDNRILSTASGGKEAAVTITTVDGFWRHCSFPALLLTAPTLRENQAHWRASLPPSRQVLGAAWGYGTGFRGGAIARCSCMGQAGPGESQGELW